MKSSKIIPFLFVLLIFACSDSNSTGNGEEENLEPSLRNSPTFPVGFAIQQQHLNNGNYVNILREDARSLSAEYEMKMNILYPSSSGINYEPINNFLEYAELNDTRVHGHALIWHSSTPGWLENFSGSDSEFESIVENYIRDIVSTYKGRIASWDVVNEAFSDGSGEYRNSVFYQKMGETYIEKAFQWAREADPDLLLFYNDYGTIYDQDKYLAMIRMIDDFQDRGIPIDGVGFQMHVSYNFPSLEAIENAVQPILDRGLMVHFSELDIRVNPEGEQVDFNAEFSNRLTARVEEIFGYYRTIPGQYRYGITFWGVKDDDTWLRDFWQNQNEWPLIYDENFQPKEAHQAIIDMFAD